MRFRLLNAAAALLLTLPGISHALSLGEVQLKSALNAPLNAEIELFATAEEMTTLAVQLASRDTFTRYGLDYPGFFSGVQVRVARLADGRNIVHLSTTAPITEPFATFLVEANAARSLLRREYTVLFDPPTFAPPAATPAPPVVAPAVGPNRSSEIARPVAPAPTVQAPAARPAVTPAAPPAGGGGDYTVPRGDSLSSIAALQYGEGAIQQGMIAIFRSNPQAFGGNINQLRAGSVLRLPSNADVAAVDRGEAVGEVRRQMAEWSGRAAGGASAPRLVLVPPGGASAGADAGGPGSPSPGSPSPSPATSPDNRVQVGDAGLARIQGNATPPAVPAPAPQTAAPTAPGDIAAGESTPPAADADSATTPVVPAVDKVPEARSAGSPAKPAAPAESDSSLLGLLRSFWFVPAALALLALVLVALAARRRRAATADGFAPFAVEPRLTEDRDTSADTLPLRKPTEGRNPSIVVEENTVPRAASTRKEAPRTVDLDEAPAATPGVDATGSFEQGDPLAEADFHMAYGLYDQAADLVKLAIARESDRRDLKLKLLEVYFVWGNQEQFLQTARELAESRDAAQPGEWEKVVIMGKQLAPEDPLFTQSYGGVSPSSVDLNLEGGQNLVDFDLPGESSTRLPQLGDGTTPGAGFSGLDFVLDDPARGSDGDNSATTLATQQLIAPTYSIDGPTVEQPFAIDGPTVEQPALGLDDTLAGKLGARRQPFGGTDQTAELAIDDLGLDLGKLEATGSNLLDDSQLAPVLGAGDATGTNEISETLVAGLDDTARRLLQQAGNAEATELLPLTGLGSGDTSQVVGLDLNFDIDTDANASTGKRLAPDFDLDVGESQSADGEYQRTQRLEPMAAPDVDATQRDLEPVSMSEVGTKLDLARAYMDMGDPDGARSILGEVLAEGSATQRQEAQRLLDSIPG